LHGAREQIAGRDPVQTAPALDFRKIQTFAHA
jgi:hypothetical protein